MCGQGGPANRKESALLVTGLQRRCCGCLAHVGTGGGGGDGGAGAGGGSSKCRRLWVKEGKGVGGTGRRGGGERKGGLRWMPVRVVRRKENGEKKEQCCWIVKVCPCVSMQISFAAEVIGLVYPVPADSNITIPVCTLLPFLSTVILLF